MKDAGAPPPHPEDPPLLGRWPNVYLLLVIQLSLVVGALYALTRWAS